MKAVRQLTPSELLNLLNQFKFKLYQHIELPERCHKQNYIAYLERNINELTVMLKPITKAA